MYTMDDLQKSMPRECWSYLVKVSLKDEALYPSRARKAMRMSRLVEWTKKGSRKITFLEPFAERWSPFR